MMPGTFTNGWNAPVRMIDALQSLMTCSLISQGELPVLGFPSLVLVSGAAYVEIVITDTYGSSPGLVLELGWIGTNATNHYQETSESENIWRSFVSVFSQKDSYFATASWSVKAVPFHLLKD